MFFLLISGVGKSMFQNCCNLFKVYPHIAWTISVMKGISGLAIRLEDMKDLIIRLEATEGIKGLIIGLETNKNAKNVVIRLLIRL